METNNIVAAPQIVDVDKLFEIWKQTHTGPRATFFKFLTTPSADRDNFLNAFNNETSFNGAVASTITRIK